MTVERFEDELRTLLRAKPFKPFIIVMDGDRSIYVDEPAVSFGGGAGGFIDANEDVHFFKCHEVHEFRLASEELTK